ncbi:site-specific integrase [Gottschalkiaceae bacterium SANA]|nr:site-specific integrase [Gottschalkiaceae bacterium SANA]
MAAANPIRDKRVLKDITEYLKMQSDRDYILFMLGIYSGLRISDILKLKVSDVRDQEYFMVTEQKTGNVRKIIVNPELRREVALYVCDKDNEDYLIRSRQNYNRPITRQRAYQIINAAGGKYGVKLSTHSMRKTFGHHFYLQCGERNALPVLMKIYGHRSEVQTLDYIGVEQDYLDRTLKNFRF